MTEPTILQSPDILEEIIEELPELKGRVAYERYGSIVIYGSVEEGASDDDLLVWASDKHLLIIRDALTDRGFYPDGAYDELTGKFNSFRKGINNIVLVKDVDIFNKYILAAKVTKDLEVYNKGQRIMVYHAIVDGEWREPRGYDPGVDAGAPVQGFAAVARAVPGIFNWEVR